MAPDRVLGLLLLASPGRAAGPEAPPASPVHATYDIYAVGVQVATLAADFTLGARDYRLDLAYHTTGLAGALFSGHQTSSAQGSWDGDRPAPSRFSGDGLWRGQVRRILIDYQEKEPVVRTLIPPNDAEREPVPPDLQARSIDTLSALALLIRRVGRTGSCEAEATTFDGRRAVTIAAHTGTEEQLAREGRSNFSGRALRCDFDGKLLAGFLKEDDRREAQRIQHGSAWFAPVVPGAPPVPVRISFETRWFGMATMYLTGAGYPTPAAPRAPP